MLDFNLDVRAFYPDLVAVYGFESRRPDGPAGGEVKHGAVPGTSYIGAVDLAFTERAADVSTTVINRVKSAANIEQGDFVSFHLDKLGAADRDFIDCGDFYELRHGL